ncbi:hypothetical protein TGVAND_201140 [Toxoplasma gondii VAND]|uniref:Uncharacterized protein n=1 Tax=Toxoplasma gondii VAND TaxID=933077 RepID=A0A086Q2N3_TOXGO|nr:hypothetical protein TGVAND_201140 [Toxoplasma gondii VAND]
MAAVSSFSSTSARAEEEGRAPGEEFRRAEERGRRGAGGIQLSYGEGERRRDRDAERESYLRRHKEDSRHERERRRHPCPSDHRLGAFSWRRYRQRNSPEVEGYAPRRSRSRTPSYESARRGRDRRRDEDISYRSRQRSRERERTQWRTPGPRTDHREDNYSSRRERRRSFSDDPGMDRRDRGRDARGDSYRDLREEAGGDSRSGRREDSGRREETEGRHGGDTPDERETCTGIQFSPCSQTNRDERAVEIEDEGAGPVGASTSASPLILRPRGDGVGPAHPSTSSQLPPPFKSSYGATDGDYRGPLSGSVVRLSPVSAPAQGFALGQRGPEDATTGFPGDRHEGAQRQQHAFDDGSRHRGPEGVRLAQAVTPGMGGRPDAAGAEPNSLQPFGAQMCRPPPPPAPTAFPSVPHSQSDNRFRPSLSSQHPSHPHSFPPPSCPPHFPSPAPPLTGPPAGLCPRPGDGSLGHCRPPYPPPLVMGAAGGRAVPGNGEGPMFLNASSGFPPSGPLPNPTHAMVAPPPYFGPPRNGGGLRPGPPPLRHGPPAGPLGSDAPGRPPLGTGGPPPNWVSGRGEENPRGPEAPGRPAMQRPFEEGTWRETGGPGFHDEGATCCGAENTAGTAPVVLRLAGVPGPFLTHENMLSFCSMFGQVAHVDVQPGQQSVRATFADPAAAAEAGRNAPRAFGAPALVVEIISQLSGVSGGAVSAVSPPSALHEGSASNAVLIHTPGSNKFVSAEYVEKQKQLEELQRKREQCAKKKQELLAKLTESLKEAIARLTDAQTPENEKEAVRAMIASIKEKISLLSDDKQKDARPEEEVRLEEKLRRLQAEAVARGLNPRLLLQQAAAQNPYKLDFRTTYIKCSGPALDNIQDQETFTEWVLAHSDALLADAIEAILRVEEGGTSFSCLKYINRQAAEQVMRNRASLDAHLEWMAPPALPEAPACASDASLFEAREGEEEPRTSSLAAAYDSPPGFAAAASSDDLDGRRSLLDSDLEALRREESRAEERNAAVGHTPGTSDKTRTGQTASRDGGKPFDQHHSLHETEVDYDFE